MGYERGFMGMHLCHDESRWCVFYIYIRAPIFKSKVGVNITYVRNAFALTAIVIGSICLRVVVFCITYCGGLV